MDFSVSYLSYSVLRRKARDSVRTAVSAYDILTRHRHVASLRRAAGHLVAEVQTPGGCLYVHLLDLGVGRPLYTGGEYERDETQFLQRTLRPGMTVIDVGANIGYMTLLASRAVGPGGRVLAIEPDPANADLLAANVSRNDRQNVTIQRCAVGSRSGTALLYRSAWNMGNHRLNAGAGGQAIAHEAIEVPVQTVDELVSTHNLGRVDLVKIDVEGYEPGVLDGMQGIIERDRPTILTEFWPYGMRDAGFDPEAFLDKLIQARYEAHTLARPDAPCRTASDILATLPDQGPGTYENLVFVPIAIR